MNHLRSVSLALLGLWIVVTPSCQGHFQTGIVEITAANGNRILHQNFSDGQIGKIGHGMIFRARLQDGSTILLENKEATEPDK